MMRLDKMMARKQVKISDLLGATSIRLEDLNLYLAGGQPYKHFHRMRIARALGCDPQELD